MRGLRMVGLILAGALAGCSPYNYGTEISAISKSVDQLSTSLNGAYSGLGTDYAARTQRYWAIDNQQIKLRDNCRDPVEELPKDRSKESKEKEEAGEPPVLSDKQKENRAPCVLQAGVIKEAPVRPKQRPRALDDEATRAKAMRAMAVLKAYAQGLAAVTNAEDRATYNAAVSKLSSSVESIAKLADPVAPGVSAIAAAGVNLVGWLIGTSLDQQRFATLKEAINKVDKPLPGGGSDEKPIAVVAGYIGLAFDRVIEARLTLLNEEVETLIYPLGKRRFAEEAYRQRLAEVNPMVDAIEGLRRSNFAWKGLADAHEKLVKAVNEGGVNIADLQKAIGEFVDKVDALKTAIDAAAKPAAAKKGG